MTRSDSREKMSVFSREGVRFQKWITHGGENGSTFKVLWDRGSTVVKVLCYKSEGRLFRSQLESLEFFSDIKSFRSYCGPGVDSASNRNEYREYFLGGKGGRCVRLTNLRPSCAVVTKSGNLNFLEPCG